MRLRVVGLVLLVATIANAETPPKLRLSDAARPTRYAARLRIIPGEPTFAGRIDIDVVLKSPARIVWLNGTGLTIGSAHFEAGGKKMAARALPGGEDFIGFAVDKPLPAGATRLHVEYVGQVSLRDDRGLFAQKEGDRWYAITQLEAIAARRVFPCFDEPAFKVPWQLTIEAPRGDAVFSNTAPVSEREENPGTKTIVFAPTPPLPSYLVALAIGPYDIVDLGRAGQKRIPMRIAAPFGRGADTRFAAQVTAGVLERLEAYFGSPFPYDKLDQVSVPLPTSFGAMENVGLVTWLQQWIVATPQATSIAFQRNYLEVAAHEIAHQWFGDLVTTVWWDDIWLNESFATWLASKVVEEWHPEWSHGTHGVEGRAVAMNADSLVSARQIRQPIAGNDDIYNAFDGITYQKGEAVLAMFERFIGADTFQKGIRKYIADHAHGNANSDDFISAMSAAAGRDLAPAFRTFLDQPGVPLVKAALSCSAGRAAALELTQQRYLPIGATAPAQKWHLPVCVRWMAGGEVKRTCILMTEAKATLPLPGPAGCPAWVLANDGQIGYYRVAYQGDLLGRILGGTRPLTLAETVGVLDDVTALTGNGSLAIGDALAFLPPLLPDAKRQVVERAIGLTRGLRENLVPDKLRPNYVRLVQRLFGARARELGWQSRPGDDDDTRLLRGSLVLFVAEDGQDRQLRAAAIELTKRWLTDRKAIDADLVEPVLATAARSGDRALFDLMWTEAGRAVERRDRTRLLQALGRFTDPRLARRALDIVASDRFDPRESALILFAASQRSATRPLAWTYVKQHYDDLARRWPPEVVPQLAFIGAGMCDEPHREEMVDFFKERAPKLPGGPHILTQATEVIGVCMAHKKAQRPSAARFLAKY